AAPRRLRSNWPVNPGQNRALSDLAPSSMPLDDDRRSGTEHWRDVGGVRFCHWDRWLLRLALDEPNGLRSIAATFEGRRTSRRSNADAEAMLAQLADLELRLSKLQCEPVDVLD